MPTPAPLRHAPHRDVVVANQQRWGWAWVSTAAGWTSRRLAPDEKCHGVGMLYPGLFCAVYAAAGAIWLQAGHRHWNAARIRTVTQRHERLRSAAYDLHLHDGDRATIRLRMPSAVVAHRLIDLTYDELDSLADDIMKVLPYTAADGWQSSDDVASWIDRALPLWQTGFPHGS